MDMSDDNANSAILLSIQKPLFCMISMKSKQHFSPSFQGDSSQKYLVVSPLMHEIICI